MNTQKFRFQKFTVFLSFFSQIEIKVLDALALRSPSLPNNVVLMSPLSEFQLKTNRDFAPGTIVTYKVVETSHDLNESVAAVDDKVLLVAGQVTNSFSVYSNLALGQFFTEQLIFLSIGVTLGAS